MLLEHLGEHDAAKRMMAAIERTTADQSLHTRDLGGNASTEAVTAAVCAMLGETSPALVS
jgi:tartrate dehydrogenase/decarboxylase/D-malate dehydrogenase